MSTWMSTWSGITFVFVPPWMTVGANVVSYSNTGLHRNRTNYYTVRSTNGSGDSPYSNTAVARTPRRSGG